MISKNTMRFFIRTHQYPEITQKIEVRIPKELRNKWYNFQQYDNRSYDTDECQECQRMSPEHLKDISDFNYNLLSKNQVK